MKNINSFLKKIKEFYIVNMLKFMIRIFKKSPRYFIMKFPSEEVLHV